MRKKVLKVSLAILILLGVLVINFLDRNILDAMYRDAKEGGLSFNDTGTEYIDYDDWLAMTWFGYFSTDYEEKYLRCGYTIGVGYFDSEPTIFMIDTEVTLANDNVLTIIADYDYDTKILTWLPLEIRAVSTKNGEDEDTKIVKQQEIMPYLNEAGITKNDLKERHDYILKDVVLKSWAKGNLRFPFNLLRGVRVEDHSWDFPE